MQRLRCVVAVALVLVLTGCEGVGEDNEIDLGQFGQLLGENLSPAQREELSQFLSDRLTAFVEEKVEGVAAEADELRAVRDGLDDADQRRQSVDQLYNADDSGPHVNETVKKKGKEEEEEEEGRVAEGENAARMARRVRRHSVLESAETAEAATTYIPPPALKQLIDAFLQDTVGPLVDKLSTMMTAATTEAATPKLTASITEAVGPQCTAALTESLTPCIVKSLTQELTSSLTKSLTHSVTQSLTNTLTHSLTHTLTHCLTYSLTRSLTHTLTQTLTQTVTHAITKALYQVVANLHNNYNYYLYYQCYYYYNHCQHVNHGVKCYFPKFCARFFS